MGLSPNLEVGISGRFLCVCFFFCAFMNPLNVSLHIIWKLYGILIAYLCSKTTYLWAWSHYKRFLARNGYDLLSIRISAFTLPLLLRMASCLWVQVFGKGKGWLSFVDKTVPLSFVRGRGRCVCSNNPCCCCIFCICCCSCCYL